MKEKVEVNCEDVQWFASLMNHISSENKNFIIVMCIDYNFNVTNDLNYIINYYNYIDG